MQPRVRIVIPACNEALRIVPTLEAYCSYFLHAARIVVVANGCTDETVAVVERLQSRYANLSVVEIASRIGKGGAIRAGFSSGDEEYLGYVDADGSTGPQEFAKLLTRCFDDGVDAAIGSRWSRGSVVKNPQPATRRVASRVFNLLVRLLFGLNYRDTQCGAKVFRAPRIRAILPRLEIANFAFDVDILVQLKRAGARIVEVPIEWADEALRSQVQLVPASISMMAAVLALRLRNSLLARIPFLEYLARRHMIPVRERIAILVLSGNTEFAGQDGRFVERVIERWQALGHDVSWIRSEEHSWMSRVCVALWYLGFGRHQYDALIEVASAVPYFLPAVSAKPRFFVDLKRSSGAHGEGRTAWAYRRFYARVPRLEETTSVGSEADVVRTIKSSTPYEAWFDREDGTWALHFTHMTSGDLKRQAL